MQVNSTPLTQWTQIPPSLTVVEGIREILTFPQNQYTVQKYKSIVRFRFYAIQDADLRHAVQSVVTVRSDFNKSSVVFISKAQFEVVAQLLKARTFLLPAG